MFWYVQYVETFGVGSNRRQMKKKRQNHLLSASYGLRKGAASILPYYHELLQLLVDTVIGEFRLNIKSRSTGLAGLGNSSVADPTLFKST